MLSMCGRVASASKSKPFSLSCTTTPHILADQKDIFDFCSLLKDWWEDATVTGGVCHQEEKVTIGNLLHHKYPAAKKEVEP